MAKRHFHWAALFMMLASNNRPVWGGAQAVTCRKRIEPSGYAFAEIVGSRILAGFSSATEHGNARTEVSRSSWSGCRNDHGETDLELGLTPMQTTIIHCSCP